MRILVTGSRLWSDTETLRRALLLVTAEHTGPVTVIHGGAPGADRDAREFAEERGWATELHEPDWDKHGKAAGPLRNQEMVDSGADVCVAFIRPDAANRGTRDCTARAKAAGIPVIVIVPRSQP